jgi:DHA2 family multidrug resistance protein
LKIFKNRNFAVGCLLIGMFGGAIYGIITLLPAGMVFVPLTTATMSNLSNEQMGNASGLFNLLRNIGGSIGISMVDTMLARHQQIRYSELVPFLNPESKRYRNLFEQLYGYMSRHAPPNVAKDRAYSLLERTVERQAAVLSYIDVFRYLALVVFLCIPIIFFMKKVKAKGPVAAH